MIKYYITPKGYNEEQLIIKPPFKVLSEALNPKDELPDLPILADNIIITHNIYTVTSIDHTSLTENWKISLPHKPFEHSLFPPVIFKGKVIFRDSTQKLAYIYDLNSGVLLKKIKDFTVDLYQLGDYLFGFDYADGKDYIIKCNYEEDFENIWKTSIGTDWSTRVLLDSNRIVFNTRNGFNCHDWETGKFLWEFNKKGKHLLWNGQVIIPDGRFTTSLDIHTGAVQWQQQTTNLVEGTIYDDKLFLANATHYSVLDVKTGKIEIDMSFKHIYENLDEAIVHSNAYGLAITEDYAIFGLSSGYLFIIDKWTGKLIWHYQSQYILNTTPLVDGNRIYVAGSSHNSANILVIEGSK